MKAIQQTRGGVSWRARPNCSGRESKDEIWSKYCGFLDLDLSDFMAIQKRLLMEQIGLFGACELGQKFLGDRDAHQR